MNASAPVELSHQELSLLLFALEGETATASESPPSCEEACPVVENLEEMFGAHALPHEKQLARHLGNHLREALVECGMFELMGAGANEAASSPSVDNQAKLREITERLKRWTCEIKLGEPDKKMLSEAVSRLPRSAWISMPRTLWRLRKKLKAPR
ncbi:MAG TPA: hypothetical protein VF747_13670 [Blastocatellia bacterium]|jgi:hypothetical protein